jgi:hypothetical protein
MAICIKAAQDNLLWTAVGRNMGMFLPVTLTSPLYEHSGRYKWAVNNLFSLNFKISGQFSHIDISNTYEYSVIVFTVCDGEEVLLKLYAACGQHSLSLDLEK